MEPWNVLLGKLTKPNYSIKWGGEWFQVLESHLTIEYGNPITMCLVAQIPIESRRYNLELGGKDSRIWDLLIANIPAPGSMTRDSRAYKFHYGRVTFAYVYYSK